MQLVSLIVPVELAKISLSSIFQDSKRVIGKSFQPAIIVPQQSFIGHDNARAQEYLFPAFPLYNPSNY